MSASQVTVLVNSTDSFEETWYPFFKLFTTFWPDCPYPVVLNCETKTFSYPGINIRCSHIGRGWEGPGRIPWSDCLIRCLQQIDSEYVLYLQDDYFINGPVDQATLEEFIDVMESRHVPHVRLLELAVDAGHRQSPLHPLLWEIDEAANYRVSLQAGLWRRECLLSYLEPGESAWEFERAGTRRSYRRKDLFLCQSLEHFNAQRRFIVPYFATGIVKGKWYGPAVIELFKEHDIQVDFSRRGFYPRSPLRKLITRTRAAARRMLMWAYRLSDAGD
jgi:hypothetical protein